MAERRIEPGAIVERAIDALRELPRVDGDAAARIVAAAARARAEDARPNEDDLLPPATSAQRAHNGLRTAVAAAAAMAAAVTSVAVWRATHSRPPASASIEASAPVVAVTSASRDPNTDAAPVPTQFVFDGSARRVTLVGDFNNWDGHTTPLEREPGSTLWSVTVPIQRGRHVYAFLVDSVWTLDKRAPVARDADFGVTGSVVLVGRP